MWDDDNNEDDGNVDNNNDEDDDDNNDDDGKGVVVLSFEDGGEIISDFNCLSVNRSGEISVGLMITNFERNDADDDDVDDNDIIDEGIWKGEVDPNLSLDSTDALSSSASIWFW